MHPAIEKHAFPEPARAQKATVDQHMTSGASAVTGPALLLALLGYLLR